MDPYKGVIRWSVQRARNHFRGVLATVIGIPAVCAIITTFINLPRRPTRVDRIDNGLVVLGCGMLFIALLAYLYALFRAPYEQRHMLRRDLSIKCAELSEIEISTSETLTLADVEQMRTAPSTDRPNECSQLRLAIAFRNDSSFPIKYAIKSASVELGDFKRSLEAQAALGRIAPGNTSKSIIYIDLNPTLSGSLVGFLEYRTWYGPITDPQMYEQECRIRFTNAPAPIGMPVNYSFTKLSVRDELRQHKVMSPRSESFPVLPTGAEVLPRKITLKGLRSRSNQREHRA